MAVDYITILWIDGRLEHRLGPLDLETRIEQVVDIVTDTRGGAG